MRGSNNKIGDKDSLLGTVVGFANDNSDKPIYEMTKQIKVKIIDWKKVIQKMKDSSDIMAGLDFEIRSGDGIIFVENPNHTGQAKPVLIDEECCGVDGEMKTTMLDGKMCQRMMLEGIGIFQIHKKNDDGSRKISMMPSFYMDFDFDDIELCFTGEEKELWEFMGERYEYNPRIHSNLREIVSLYKKGE